MKRNPLYYALTLLLATSIMTACEETGTTDDPDNGSGNYWTKSYAFHMQLKGKVKTLIIDTTSTLNFDEKGNLLTKRDEWGQGYSLETYIYNANGKIVEHRQANVYPNETYGDTMAVSYGNHGKYVPLSGYHIQEDGLYYNLDLLDGGDNVTRYVVSGDSLLMIGTYTYSYDGESMTESDTIGLGFDGGKYPVRLHGGLMWGRYTYAADGRFLTAESGHGGFGNSWSKQTFSAEGPYQLLVKVEQYYNGALMSESTYTYNEHGDQTGVVEGAFQGEYTGYVYDAQGNWTERMYRYKNGADWTTPEKETRQITYWD